MRLLKEFSTSIKLDMSYSYQNYTNFDSLPFPPFNTDKQTVTKNNEESIILF